MMEITGGCFCGYIRYVITTVDITPTICHCAGCRKAAGAPALAWITVKAADFRLAQGELRSIRATQHLPNSCDCHGGTRGFCPTCGTHITYLGDGQQNIDITTASLDDPNAFPPSEDVWPDQKVAWMKMLA